ncbi:MAG TPA: amidohydrolase family protein [Gemmataceae bacterium]|nr:amidohydrolase family protein [Gemmataceae bacterium]
MRAFGPYAVALSLPLILILIPVGAAPAEDTIAYRGARILTAAGAPIDKGVLIVRKDKIIAIGAQANTPIPEGVKIIDLSGKTVIPGLVDTHSHIGIWPKPHVPANNDGNEGSGPVQSALRALDAIQPDDPGIRMAVAGGVTTANIMPGSANVIGGQTVYVKMRGRTIEEMRVVPATVLGGLKMANGENPKSWNYQARKMAPATRMKIAALQREQFTKARDYRRAWQRYRQAKADGKDVPQPEVDLALEPLVEVLDRKRTVHFHSHRADDLMTAIRLSKEFNFELVLQHCTEGYRIAEELVREKIPVSLTLVDSPGGKLEVAGLLEENASILDKAGVKVAINTDDSITESRFFLRTGAIAVRGGMSEDAALRALTLHGAQMLHLDDRLGSLEKGKDADFVVLSGSPFSVYTHVLQTYIDGKCVFDHSKQGDWSYQAGGFALQEHDRLPKWPPPVKPLAAVETPLRRLEHKPWRENAASFAILAGRIDPVATKSISNGVILVENGKIKALGSAFDVKVPDGWPVLTAAVVTPGLIDAHTVVGISGAANVAADQDQDEMSDPNQADLRVMDSFNPREPLLEFLCREGVTVVHAVPGRANVIAGQTGIFRTSGRTAESMTLRFPAGLLVNLGEAPKSSYTNRQPTTRMGTAALLRTALAQAQNHARKSAAAKSEDKRPPYNPKLEALGLALDGRVPVIFAAHRADDLCTALRVAKEFKLSPRLDLATEGYLIADRLAAAKVPVVVHPTMQRPGSMETYHSHLCNAAVLADHKIPLAIGTGFEAYVPKTRVLRHEAAMAMVNGLGYDRALRAITLDAAHLLGLDEQRGSIEQGKVADLVLFDGDPFEHATHVTHTLIEGRVVYDRGEYLQLPFARRAIPLTGGGGVGCCLGIW